MSKKSSEGSTAKILSAIDRKKHKKPKTRQSDVPPEHDEPADKLESSPALGNVISNILGPGNLKKTDIPR
jgi:hypothetical protein